MATNKLDKNAVLKLINEEAFRFTRKVELYEEIKKIEEELKKLNECMVLAGKGITGSFGSTVPNDVAAKANVTGFVNPMSISHIEQLAKGPYGKILIGPAASLFGVGSVGVAKGSLLSNTIAAMPLPFPSYRIIIIAGTNPKKIIIVTRFAGKKRPLAPFHCAERGYLGKEYESIFVWLSIKGGLI